MIWGNWTNNVKLKMKNEKISKSNDGGECEIIWPFNCLSFC